MVSVVIRIENFVGIYGHTEGKGINMELDRRTFLKRAAVVGTGVVAATGLVACGTPSSGGATGGAEPLASGQYSASSQGFLSLVTVDLSLNQGAITDISITHEGETATKGGVAVTTLAPLIQEANGLDGVDAVSGATATSRAVFRATEECLYNAGILEQPGDVQMIPGVYFGESLGFNWIEPVRVQIEVDETSLKSIEVIDKDLNREETLILKEAEDLLIPRMIEAQSVTFDSISGATSSSAGVKSATENALKKALRAGGSSSTAIHNFYRATEKSSNSETLDYDLVICGLGGAGSAAAMSAAEAMKAAGRPVSVLAIEVAGKYGGTASQAGEPFSVNAPRYIEKYNNGQEWCDYDSLYANWLEVYGKGTPCKPECVKLFMDESGKTVDWLQFDHGFVFTNAMGGFGTNAWLCKQQYVHIANMDKGKDYAAEYPQYTFGGRSETVGQYYDSIISDFTALGGEYLLETEAYELLYDAASNRVTGVLARNVADGTEYTVNAKAVILSSGGFGGNQDFQEMVIQNPEYPLNGRWRIWGMYQNKGQMIQSAIDQGAGTYNIDMSPCLHYKTSGEYVTDYPVYYRDGVDVYSRKGETWSINDIPLLMGINEAALSVGTDGVRHFNENGTFAFWSAGPYYYTIYGGDYVDNLAENGYPGEVGAYQASTRAFGQGGVPNARPLPQIYEVLDTAVAKGYVFKADTLEKLAEQMGVPASDFVGQVERYESFCKSGEDSEFGKSAKMLVSQINKPPYYAVKTDGMPFATVAALDVDTDINVLQSDGKTKIGGLYACGNDSGGVLYTNLEPYAAYGGCALGWAFTSGRLAGTNVVAYLESL
jgi:fumarate reductase flavoprotein subunit